MNKIIILLFIVFASCGNNLTEESNIIAKDTINKEIDTLLISKHEIKILNEFKPPLKDVAIYIKMNPDKFNLSNYHFKCGKFKFWIANGYRYFELCEPYTIPFTGVEKDYFWSIYLHIRDNKKIYNWENKIIIKEK